MRQISLRLCSVLILLASVGASKCGQTKAEFRDQDQAAGVNGLDIVIPALGAKFVHSLGGKVMVSQEGDAPEVEIAFVDVTLQERDLLTVFSHFPNLESLRLLDCRIEGRTRCPIPSPRIRHLQLSNMRLSQPMVRRLFSNVQGLQVCDFSYSVILPGALAALGSCQSLEEVFLRDVTLDASAMRSISSFPSLKRLVLCGGSFHVADLKWIARCRQLQSLDLSQTGLDGSGLRPLQDLRNLESLYLGGNKLERFQIEDLISLPQLRTLFLSATGLKSPQLRSLAKLSTLQTLFLGHNPLNDLCVAEVRSLRQLRYLSMAETKITDAALPPLANLPALKELDLDTTTISDDGLELLAASPSLTRVWVSGTKVTRNARERMRQSNPGLEVVPPLLSR